MPIVEAQSIGRPVITSDITPMNETAGDGACLVDPHSSNDIRAGILRIVTDETYRNGLIQRGFQNAARFSRDAMVAEYSALYEEVLSRARGEDAMARNGTRLGPALNA
jgi:glycosyltransferase involved in cell wall biosynthesis